MIEPGITPDRAARAGWSGLLRVCALVLMVMTVLQMLLGRFAGPSLIVLDVLVVAGLMLLPRRPRAGAAVIGGSCLLNLLLHSGLLAYLLASPESGPVFAATSLNALASLTAVVAAFPVWSGAAARGVRAVLVAALTLAVVSVAASTTLWLTRAQDTARPGDIALVTDGAQVDRRSLEARTGQVSVLVRNDDALSPRAFDIDTLGVHLTVPPATTRRVTFTAPPGSYAFHDEITFTLATSGTLTVR
ncbi:cupredoxin domain-containing protein [Nonomuraea maritima]|uniref:cupredoxin domain-containing protein n=1 Tax=Nonomuraea maritima TaxID=683260 RepID=UPI003718CF4C